MPVEIFKTKLLVSRTISREVIGKFIVQPHSLHLNTYEDKCWLTLQLLLYVQLSALSGIWQPQLAEHITQESTFVRNRVFLVCSQV